MYRKMANGKSLYKIISDNQFIEIQYIGSKYFVKYFKISQYPDMLFLKEVVSANSPYELAKKEEVEKLLRV